MLFEALSVVMPAILEMSNFHSSIFSSKASFRFSPGIDTKKVYFIQSMFYFKMLNKLNKYLNYIPVCSVLRLLQPKHHECISQDLVMYCIVTDLKVCAALLVHRSVVQA